MKKSLFILMILSFWVVCATAQKKNTPSIGYTHPVASVMAFSFKTDDVSKYLGFMHIECDNKNNYWLKMQIIYPYNIKSMVDTDGRPSFGKYSVTKGKHIYLKLLNADILTFTCDYQRQVADSYYNDGHDIHDTYSIYCYFKITKDQMEKLKQSEVRKMRAELKYNVTDMIFIDKVMMNEKISELNYYKDKDSVRKSQQERLNKNPLEGF